MGFRVIDTISLLNFLKGHNSIKIAGRVTFLVRCTLSDGASYFKFRENILKGFRVIERTRFPHKCFQRAIPSKMMMELQLLIFAHRLIMLYLYQVSRNYLQGFLSF